mmetsp:Transcript_44049/g.124666  ORF Transcript_44049/g.124666 Transcript_44049/m.124666 type:complete len:211 (+) Transcript_44049:82-714(+)
MAGPEEVVDIAELLELTLVARIVVDIRDDRRGVLFVRWGVEKLAVYLAAHVAEEPDGLVILAHLTAPDHVRPEWVDVRVTGLTEYHINGAQEGLGLAVALVVKRVKLVIVCHLPDHVDGVAQPPLGHVDDHAFVGSVVEGLDEAPQHSVVDRRLGHQGLVREGRGEGLSDGVPPLSAGLARNDAPRARHLAFPEQVEHLVHVGFLEAIGS